MPAVLAWGQHSAALPALLASGLALSTFQMLTVDIAPRVLTVVFLGTFGVYQLDRVLSVGRDDLQAHPARCVWTLQRRRVLAILAAGAVACAGVVALGMQYDSLVLLGAAGGAGLLYAIELGRSGWRLKDVRWLKPSLVAAAWCVAVVAIPGALAYDSGLLVGLVFAYRLFYLLTNVFLSELVEGHSGPRRGPTNRAQLVAARCCAMVAVAVGVALSQQVARDALVVVDLVGIGGLLLLSTRALLWRLEDSFMVDVVTLWPAAAAIVHAFCLH